MPSSVDSTTLIAPPRFPKLQVPFIITNLTQQKQVRFAIDDADRSGSLSFGDTIRFVENYASSSNFNLTWTVTVDRGNGQNPALPTAGDRFLVRTTKPYQPGDTILFMTDRLLGIAGHDRELPEGVRLRQNYPNPFNPSTVIEFEIPRRAYVSLRVFDVTGREVALLVQQVMPAGVYRVPFSARSTGQRALASGIYFYRLQAGDQVQTRKLVLLK
ncbi:MAG TPA: T9SS type A sorting domain-containing protein [Bacteroidota bacterium]